jgi:hypothetical protein
MKRLMMCLMGLLLACGAEHEAPAPESSGSDVLRFAEAGATFTNSDGTLTVVIGERPDGPQ